MGSVSLHTHTTFSPLDGYGTPEQYVRRAKSIGSPAIAITEHGNTSSHVQLEKACKEHGIKPIYGCELYMTMDVKNNTREKYHVTLLAKNLEGYRNILRLSSLAHEEDHFYYMPTIDVLDLFAHSEGVVVLSGCQRGLLSQLILKEQFDEAEEWAQKFAQHFEHFYLEIQPLELPDSIEVNEGLIQISEKLGIPLVATNDAHYVNPGDEKTQWFLSAIRRRKNVHDDWGTMSPRCHLASRDDLLKWGAPVEAVDNTIAIANLCDHYELPKADPVEFGVENPQELLLDLCRQGWKKRGVPKPKWGEYKERLFMELELINSKGYTDYFLVVADMVRWAKHQGIMVGPGRGSVAGSLTAYLIGITEVDPIRWELLFERFIDVSRYDPPDIDLDFQDDRREEVKEYLREKYGLDRVANIAGYSMFKDKSLMDDLGRVFKIPKKDIDEAKNDLRENGGAKDIEDIFIERWADKQHILGVLGQVRQLTKHAAGVVVASEPIERFTTMGRDGIMLDYRDAEYLGLMKIDVLSLSTLTIINHCLKAIDKDSNWLYDEVPLDDEPTYRAFAGKNFQGIFQYEGNATKRICQQVKPQTFEQLIDINALSRPGPLQSGATEAYINGWMDDIHPIVTKYTAKSRGQILFQEQIMRILRDAGGLDWADVTAVRKLITKKQGQEKLQGIKERFLIPFDQDPSLGEEIWKRCGESGAYGFNIAHSTSYTYLGYYCMYLKVHYPLEFYWANLMVEPGNESMLREYVTNKGKVYGVKFGRSKQGWSIDKSGLRAGYLTVKGIGPKNAEKLEQGVEPKGKIKDLLQSLGAFEEEQGDCDYLGLDKLSKRLAKIPQRNRIKDIKPGEFVRVAGVVAKMEVKNLREYYHAQGKNYEADVKDPEKDTYIHLVLADETGEVAVTVNRWQCADPITWEALTEKKDDDIIFIVGEFNKKYNKVYTVRVKNVSVDEGEKEEWQ